MDRMLIILKKEENGPRASSAPALGLNTIIFKHVYWYMQQISGEHLQDHWSSCYNSRFFRTNHCRSGNIRVNLIFANIRELLASRIQGSR